MFITARIRSLPGLGFCVVLMLLSVGSEAKCRRGCNLALASYYVWEGSNLTYISELLQTSADVSMGFNPLLPNIYYVQVGSRVNIPFSCDCIDGEFLGHVFSYSVRPGNTYDRIATVIYANLTTVPWLVTFNSYPFERIPDNARLNVTVNCSCGDSSVSKDYGLFLSYPLRPGENLSSVARDSGLSPTLLQRYNPTANFNGGSGLVYFPGKDQSGSYPALKSSKGISAGIIVGIVVAVIAAALLVIAVCICVRRSKRRKMEASLVPAVNDDYNIKHGGANSSGLN